MFRQRSIPASTGLSTGISAMGTWTTAKKMGLEPNKNPEHSQHPKSSSSLRELLQSSWGSRVLDISWYLLIRFLARHHRQTELLQLRLHLRIAGIDHPLYSRMFAMVKLHRISGLWSSHHHGWQALQRVHSKEKRPKEHDFMEFRMFMNAPMDSSVWSPVIGLSEHGESQILGFIMVYHHLPIQNQHQGSTPFQALPKKNYLLPR